MREWMNEPSAWIIICCLPRSVSRKLAWRQSSLDSNVTLIQGLSITRDGFIRWHNTMPAPFPLPLNGGHYWWHKPISSFFFCSRVPFKIFQHHHLVIHLYCLKWSIEKLKILTSESQVHQVVWYIFVDSIFNVYLISSTCCRKINYILMAKYINLSLKCHEINQYRFLKVIFWVLILLLQLRENLIFSWHSGLWSIMKPYLLLSWSLSILLKTNHVTY